MTWLKIWVIHPRKWVAVTNRRRGKKEKTTFELTRSSQAKHLGVTLVWPDEQYPVYVCPRVSHFLVCHPVPKTLKWRIIIVDTFSARAAPEWKSVSYHVEHGYLLLEVCVINKCYCLFWCGGMGLTNVPVFFWVEVGVFNKCDCLLWCGSVDLTNVHEVTMKNFRFFLLQ